jgi:hypothetical protein
MPVSIESLPVVSFDYSHRGPGLHSGLTQLWKMLDTPRGREGYVVVNVTVAGAVIPTVLARSDLYLMGFQCARNWFCFDDAKWPFSESGGEAGIRTLGTAFDRTTV